MVEEVANEVKASTPEEVLAALRDDLGKDGFQYDLDPNHVATFLSRGSKKLLVTFETLENTLNVSGNGMPIGLDFVEDKNWSLLHLTARKESWFRSQAVYEFIDELVDDMFFEEFDQVMFYGAGIGAYAACAFSVAAPGATVLALSPQATLDSERAGWDMRFPEAKRLRFNDRYGYAPDMLEGAASAFILYDPYRSLDHVHASLFQGPNVQRLKCRHMDGLIELTLREMDMLHQVIELTSDGSMTAPAFYRLLRRRRHHNRYLRTVLHALNRQNRPLRVAYLCQYAFKNTGGGPFFKRNLAAATDVLRQKGPLPDWLLDDTAELATAEPKRKTL